MNRKMIVKVAVYFFPDTLHCTSV